MDKTTDVHQNLLKIMLTERGDGVTSIKQRRHDLRSDDVSTLVKSSEHGQPKGTLEDSVSRNPSPEGVKAYENIWGDATGEKTHSKVGASSQQQNDSQNVASVSFASVLQAKTIKKVVKIKELRNDVSVEGAAVAIPYEAVEEVSARFANTLYGYFIGKRLAFRLVENYVQNTWAKYGLKRVHLHEDFFLFQFETKEGMDSVLENSPWLIRTVPLILNVWSPNTVLKKAEVKKAHVWVKLHHVPIVAYSEIGLSFITTQIGKPIMLDSYTSNMCVSSWGRSTYARALIKVSADKEIMESLIIAIPVVPKETIPTNTDDKGFVEVKKKKNKNKSRSQRPINGIRLTKPPPKMYYRRVEAGESSKASETQSKGTKVLISVNNSVVTVRNSFDVLDRAKKDDDVPPDIGNKREDVLNVSDSEVDEEIMVEECRGRATSDILNKGASTPVLEDSTASGANIDISMREFRDCVEDIEVMDVHRTGLQFTWNQKPKGTNGLLKKIDRIMANIAFNY
ncbi:zinc knuckle CX2CX4HX4C containing protein [Tanacetum coccineum]